MPGSAIPTAAETTALKALGFLAESEDVLVRFLTNSGLTVGDLRARAGEPELLVSVLDFLLMDDSLLVTFCEAESLDLKDVYRARTALGDSGPE
jgi:hypothetical protein